MQLRSRNPGTARLLHTSHAQHSVKRNIGIIWEYCIKELKAVARAHMRCHQPEDLNERRAILCRMEIHGSTWGLYSDRMKVLSLGVHATKDMDNSSYGTQAYHGKESESHLHSNEPSHPNYTVTITRSKSFKTSRLARPEGSL